MNLTGSASPGSQVDSETVLYRQASPEDIPAINKLFVREYGDCYPYPLAELRHDVYYLVATNASGQVVGFARSGPYHGYERVHEFGGLIVHQLYRGIGIARQLTERRLLHARACGLVAVVSEPVCYRSACESQYNLLERGFVLIGIQPFKYPDIQGEVLGSQAESVMLAAKYLVGDSGFCRRPLYLPDDMQSTISLFIPEEVLARSRVLEVSSWMPPVEYHKPHRGEQRVGSEYVDIPVNWPESHDLILSHQEKGYRFSSVLPGFGHTERGGMFDYVRMYRPPSQEGASFNRVHVAGSMEALKQHMRSRDPVAD